VLHMHMHIKPHKSHKTHISRVQHPRGPTVHPHEVSRYH
jgi:hypothetical protein